MQGEYKAEGNVWWGRNLPNNVATGPDIVVQESQACFGNEIGETHNCRCGCEYGMGESKVLC
jgi:hypothetical protein